MAWLDPSVKAAIFDIGATLVTGPPVAPNKVIAGLLGNISHSDVSSVIMTMEFSSADDVCAELESRFVPLGQNARDGIAQLWRAQCSAPTEIEGASETVCELKRLGLGIGLLSNIWSPYYRGVETAIPKAISASDSIVLSFHIGSRKPEAEPFLIALDQLGVRPEEAVMIGDTYEHDILPAIELGLKTIWVLARPDRESESIVRILNGELPAPTATVGHIGEVPSLHSQLSTLNSER